MSRPSLIEKHPDRAAIERALVEGRPIVQIAEQFRISRNTLYRFQARQLMPALREQLRGESRQRASRLIERLVNIADDLARSREVLQAHGDIAGAVRAGDAETRAISVLLDRIGVDDMTTLDLLNDGDQLARAAGQLARSNPEAGKQLVGLLRNLGATDLAEALTQTMNPDIKEIQNHG